MIVGEDAVTGAATQQFIDRHAQRLAFDIPEGDVDGGDGGGQDALRREEATTEEHLPEMLRAEGILANEQGLEVFDGALHRQFAPGNSGFTQTADAFVRLDDNEAKGAPLPGEIDFHIGNLHAWCSCAGCFVRLF